MKCYQAMSRDELLGEYQKNLAEYQSYQAMGFSLNMARGIPGEDQLELSMPMLDTVRSDQPLKSESGIDVRSYGLLDGLPETKALFAEILGVQPENILVGGNSSLNMMFDSINWSFSLGVMGSTPWAKLDSVKFLCPVPGYDRHFAITQLFGIEMINIPLTADGPDMDLVQKYVENDPTVKGIWCVPMYSNPTGITYSDETVRRFAALKPAAEDFRIYWDNAYCVHHLSDTPDRLLNIFDACRENGNENMVYEFASTSKISFSGAGIAVMAASDENMQDLKSKRTIQTIGPNKINQLMHSRFFHNYDTVKAHMKKHQALIAPKFKVVLDAFDAELAPRGLGAYTKPNGGYFISFNTLDGCAQKVVAYCRDAGVILTSAGATFPYGKDPDDKNIRIAPTYPQISALETAMKIFCVSVKLASAEKLLGN
jgi:aspartate/methionine/tyrosine aminotransferase